MSVTTLKSFSAKSDQGPFLTLNEDNIEVDLVNKLFILLDGFGGSGIGDLVSRKLIDSLKTFYTSVVHDQDSTLPFYYSNKYLVEGNCLVNSLLNSHEIIKNDNSKKDLSMRGGASGIVASLANNILTVAGTGNCKAMLFRHGTLEEVYIPDSIGNVAGDISSFPMVTAPMSGFGLFDDFHYSIREIRLRSDDLIVFLSDGAYSRVNRDEMKYILGKSVELREKVDEVFTLSNERGNRDNQSAIMLHF